MDYVAANEPKAGSLTLEVVCYLAGNVDCDEKEGECDSNVGGDEHLAIELGKDDREGEENSVASLIGGEAMVVWERGSVLDAGHGGKEEQEAFGRE